MISWKHRKHRKHRKHARKPAPLGVLRGKRIFAAAREYHQHHHWKLNRDGIMVRHAYTDMTSESLSWWDDLGFIFAKRRVMVWWLHPRMVYMDRLEALATEQCAAEYPKGQDNWLAHSTPIHRAVQGGRRKRTVGHRMGSISERYRQYFDHLQATQDALSQQDHGWSIMASLRSEVLGWCQGVNLVVPMEVRCEDDLRPLRDLVERYLRGDRSALTGFPAYTFADWQKDQEQRRRKRGTAEDGHTEKN